MSSTITIETKVTIKTGDEQGLQPIELKRCCETPALISPQSSTVSPAAAMCSLPACPTANGDYLVMFSKTDAGCESKAVAK